MSKLYWIGAAVMCGVVLAAIANHVYRMRYQTFRRGCTKALVVSGAQTGRVGVVVSDAPFDIWVTINTEPKAEERLAWLNARLDEQGETNRAWLTEMAHAMRWWVTAWRWQVEWIPSAGYDVGGRILAAPTPPEPTK